MNIPLPPGAQVIEPAEAIRRIQERDHAQPQGPYLADEVIISMIRKGMITSALTADGKLAFWPNDLESGEPFDPDNPDHLARA